MTMNMNVTGKIIHDLRKKEGYTQAQFADLLGVSDKAVSKWERGLSYPDTTLLPRIAILLDTDIESLLYGGNIYYENKWCGILILDQTIDPMIHVHGIPLIHYFLSSFLLVGIREILLINDNGRVLKYLREHLDFGVRFFSDVEIDKFVGEKNVFLMKGNTYLYGLDLTKNMQRAMANLLGASVLSVMGPEDLGEKELIFDKSRRIISNEKMRFSKAHFYEVPFLFCPSQIWNRLEIKDISFESVADKIREKKLLYTHIIGRGMVCFRFKNKSTVDKFEQFVLLMNEIQRETIGNLDEIARNRGFKK